MRGKDIFIGEGAIVGEDVLIGDNTKIWHYCNLYGCEIGNNTQIGSYSEIKSGAKIGNYCRLQSYIFIPEETEIGNKVFIGPRVTFLNDKFPNVEKTLARTWKLEKVVVEEGASIGGGSIILPGVRIGKEAIIGAGSNVTKDVPANTIVYGNPARIYKRRDL